MTFEELKENDKILFKTSFLKLFKQVTFFRIV